MIDFIKLFCSFFKIGIFTFGGGLAMIPFIEDEFVAKKKWLTSDEMRELALLAQTLPGVIAVNLSIFVGQRRKGWAGSIAALLGTVLPSLITIMLLLLVLRGFEDNKYVLWAFVGIKATASALILDAVIRMSKKTLGVDTACWIVASISLLIVILGYSAVWPVIFGAIIGLTYFYWRMGKTSTENDKC